MSFIPEKKDALYVRGVVIAAGMPDDQGDIAPNKEGIKRIFTNYLKQESDVQHSYISNFNVHQLENTITTAPMKINGQDVPVGSWIASHMVLNPSIVAMIRANNLTGYSLGAIGDAGLNENITFENNFLNKSGLLYKDLRDYEELNPFFISFVEKASNGFTWEVMDYTQFLSKSSKSSENITGENMTEIIEENEEMVKVSVVERLLGPLLSKASEESSEPPKEEEEEEEEAPVEENEPPKEEEEEEEKLEKETETGISNDVILAKFDELPSLVANSVIEAMKKMAAESAPEQEEEEDILEKASNEEEEEIVKKEDSTQNSENESEEVEDEDKLEKGSQKAETSENEKMQKSSNKLDEMSKPKAKPKAHFLGSERRDEYGRVRKYL